MQRIVLATAFVASVLGALPASAMPNPASVACVKAGGRLEIRRQADGGEFGACHTRRGRVCEEWALFRDHRCVTPPPDRGPRARR